MSEDHDKDEIDNLEKSLAGNLKEAEFLAFEAVNTSRVALVSPRFTRIQMETLIKESRKLVLRDQVACLTIVTDQIVSLIVSPAFTLSDISQSGLVRLLQMVCKEWNKIFEQVIRKHSSGGKLVTKDFMKIILAFLQGQFIALSRLENKAPSGAMLMVIDKNNYSRDAFWSYNLESVEGKVNPTPCKRDKEPAVETLFSRCPSALSTPAPSASSLEKVVEQRVPVENIMLETLTLHQFPMSNLAGKFELQVFDRDFIITNGKLTFDFTVRELSRVIFSPQSVPQSLYLFLSPRGAIKVMTMAQGIPEIPKSACASFGKDRKMVLKLQTPLSLSQKNRLKKCLLSDIGIGWADVRPTFARFLDLGLVHPDKAFNDLSVRIEDTTEISADEEDDFNIEPENAIQDVIETVLEEALRCSLRKEAGAVARDIMEEILELAVSDYFSGSYNRKRKVSNYSDVDPFGVIMPNPSMAMSLPSPDVNSNYPEKLAKSSTWHSSQADTFDIPLLVSNNPQEFYQMNRNLLEQKFPDMTQLHDKILDLKWKEMTVVLETGYINDCCPPPEKKCKASAASNNLADKVAQSKVCGGCYTAPKVDEEAFSICSLCYTVAYCSVQCQNLDWSRHRVSCKKLATASAAQKKEILQSQEKKRPRIYVSKSLYERELEVNNSSSSCEENFNEVPSSAPKKSPIEKKEEEINTETKTQKTIKESFSKVEDDRFREIRPKEVKDCIDLTKEDSVVSSGEDCSCGDCKYMTKSHKTRILSGKYKCKCHPCVLRKNLLLVRKTDPYKVVKLKDFKEKSDYWSQSWMTDLLEDMFDGKVDLPSAISLTGSNKIETKFKEYQEKREKSMKELTLD